MPTTPPPDDPTTELPADVAAAIATLKQHAKAHGDAIVDALHGTPVYQAAFDAGHREATARGKAKLDEVKGKLTAAEERAAAAERDRDAAKQGAPDLAARDAAWQKKLDAKDEEIRTERERAAKKARDTVETKTESALIAAGLRPRIAKLVAPTYVGRVREKDDGTHELLGDGDIPVQVPKGKTVWDVIGQQARSEAEPNDIVGNGDQGGGVGGGGGGGGARTPQAQLDALKTQKRAQMARGGVV